MTKSKKCFHFFKSFFLLTMCVCLIGAIYTQTVKSTSAYVTSLSDTCVNVFVGDEQPGPTDPSEPTPSEPTDPSRPPAPPTGDNSHMEWYLCGLAASLAALILLWIWNPKRDEHTD